MASKRTVLITGCSDGGLGSSLALAFHNAGWRVFASARDPKKLSATVAAGIESVVLDVSSEDSLKQAVATVSELAGGSLDALVNNAGATYRMPILDLDLKKVRGLFELNVISVIATIQAFFPLLLKSPKGGMVINNSSIVVYAGVPFEASYNASKAATSMLTRNLRLELEPFGIKVVELVTGLVQTNIYQNSPTASLPANSVYNVAKEDVEKFLGGAEAHSAGADATQWAKEVVQELSKEKLPAHVWKGAQTLQVRIASMFPSWILDGTLIKMSGLDAVARKVMEGGGLAKLKRA
jgi:1-acylglycerone phosphate reductase